jgi:hypothetical protein
MLPDRGWFDGIKFLPATPAEIGVMDATEKALYADVQKCLADEESIDKQVIDTERELHATVATIRDLEAKVSENRISHTALVKDWIRSQRMHG